MCSLTRVALVVVAVFVCATCNRHDESGNKVDEPKLPIASEVQSMKVLIRLDQDQEFKEHETIDVNPSHFANVLAELQNARREPSPVPGWVYFGGIQYVDKSGTDGAIMLFISERRELAFRTDGERYYRGGDIRQAVAVFRSAGKR